MKNIKRCFCSFSFYEQQAIEETLERMAAKGWMIQKAGNFIWSYKRMEPKKLRFSVNYFPSASDFDPGPTDKELRKIDYCRQDGWILAASRGPMQIFYNESMDAVPIETEPVVQVENICRCMKKTVLFPLILMCAWLIFYFATRIVQLKNNPVDQLSDPFSLYSILTYGALILASLCEIVFYFYWSRKAKAAAQRDGVFLPIKGRPAASRMFTVLSALFLLLACSALDAPFGAVLSCICVVFLISAVGNIIKGYLKKRGVSRSVNCMVYVGSVFFLTLFFLGVITVSIISGGLDFPSGKTAVGTYELYGRTREIYNDPLPLEIEELADVSAQWSKEARRQETILLSSTQYRQYAVSDEGNGPVEENELEYTVAEVKWDFLYDFIKGAVLDSRKDETGQDDVFTNHYEPVDPSVWNADDAYQLHWSDSVMDIYLICWGNRIVELKFYWEPTPEQMAVAAERLQKALGR